MPNTGDATGAVDTRRALQELYRAFQDNGVPILGLAIDRVVQNFGLPPTVHVQVRLDHGRPVVSNADALPEGGTVPPADSLLTINLTQANNSIGGWSWYASGTLTNLATGEHLATATSIPTTGWSDQVPNDPGLRDRWNALLPQSAYGSVEMIKQKLEVRAGVVAAAVPATATAPASRSRVPIAVVVAGIVAVVVAAIVGVVLATRGGSQGPTPVAATTSASSSSSAASSAATSSSSQQQQAASSTASSCTGPHQAFTINGTPVDCSQAGQYPCTPSAKSYGYFNQEFTWNGGQWQIAVTTPALKAPGTFAVGSGQGQAQVQVYDNASSRDYTATSGSVTAAPGGQVAFNNVVVNINGAPVTLNGTMTCGP